MWSWKVRLLLAAAIGLALPLVNVALACRDPMSERCVWGKALLPFTVPVSLVVIGGIVFGVLTIVAIAREGRRAGRS